MEQRKRPLRSFQGCPRNEPARMGRCRERLMVRDTSQDEAFGGALKTEASGKVLIYIRTRTARYLNPFSRILAQNAGINPVLLGKDRLTGWFGFKTTSQMNDLTAKIQEFKDNEKEIAGLEEKAKSAKEAELAQLRQEHRGEENR